MPSESFGVHLSSASVDRGDGSDPRGAARDVLARMRVLGGIRDSTAEWADGQEAVVAIPVTDDGHVLTLGEDDTIESILSAEALRAAFLEQGLALWSDPEELEPVGADPDLDLDDVSAEAESAAPGAIDPDRFEAPSVQVSAFSHRGPATARILASVRRMTVDHRESGDWSLQRFATSEPTGDWVSSKAELPVIELNRADVAVWFEVTCAIGGPIPFWTEAERDTRPVLDIDAIRIPETAEIYRLLLTEGDGSRDELVDIAAAVSLDVDGAHRALIPEALGGVVGAEGRQRAFLAAFGISPDLIDAAFEDVATGPVRRFLPGGWWPTVRETAIAGLGELTPLTRRERPLARLGDALRRRPVTGLSLSLGELGAGLWAASRGRGAGKAVGVLLMVDAVIDAAIWIVRIRRSRRR